MLDQQQIPNLKAAPGASAVMRPNPQQQAYMSMMRRSPNTQPGARLWPICNSNFMRLRPSKPSFVCLSVGGRPMTQAMYQQLASQAAAAGNPNYRAAAAAVRFLLSY
jgi:hypothetical protein